MSIYPAPVLETKTREAVALEGVNVEATLHDLTCQVEVSQTYRNTENVNIEAVYTFPLPLDAVFLNFEVIFKNRTLKGIVIEKRAAEEQYENAITEGNAAFMLQQAEPGLYTMNVGNLFPGEEVTIRFTYAILYRWQGDSLRFYIPTTISPRYGDALRAGFQPHQVPEYDSSNVNDFSLRITITGLLKSALLDSPSHRTRISRNGEGVSVELDGGRTEMDRDFILNIKSSDAQRDSVIFGNDIEGYALLASFNPRLSTSEDPSPKSIKIVVDCSGSMEGDSIVQAGQALWRILDSLRPQDYFNIITFGSKHKIMFREQVEATPGNLRQAREFVRKLNADMGGTEIGKALYATFRIKCQENLPQNVLLITDGEVFQWKAVVRKARLSKHRIFTVGVGRSVSEAFVCQLADETGGASEFAIPDENMAEKIYRQFKRIYSPAASDVSILWPSKPAMVIPDQLKSVFDGDTVHVYAKFSSRPEGDVILHSEFPGGIHSEQVAHIAPSSEIKDDSSKPGLIARLAADALLRTVTEPQKVIDIAIAYQLMSPHTNYLVVDERSEPDRAGELPELRVVPQMPAAGWGGGGTVHQSLANFSPVVMASIRSSENRNIAYMAKDLSCGPMEDESNMPLQHPDLPRTDDMNIALKEIVNFAQHWGERGHEFHISRMSRDDIWEVLRLAQIPDDIREIIAPIFWQANWGIAAIIMFLFYLCQTPAGEHLPKRVIEEAVRDLRINDRLEHEMRRVISGLPF